MAPTEDHDRLADELAAEADRLARENEHLADEIDQVRSEWHAKQQDPGVPGAVPPENDAPEDDAASEDRPGRRSST